MDIDKISEELRSVSAKRREKEGEKTHQTRFQSVMSRREQAINKIREYQKLTGVPSDDETVSQFIKDAGLDITLEEFREKEITN